MTDRRRRERSLPEGYQFGDAGRRDLSRLYDHDFAGDSHRVGETIGIKLPRWRAPHLNAASNCSAAPAGT